MTRRFIVSGCLFLGVFLAAVGCGGPSAPSAPTGEDAQVRGAMKVLGMEYGGYLLEHNQTPPKDETALRDHIGSRLAALSVYNVKSVDDLVRSGRDGKPLTIITGAKVVSPEDPTYPWVAYEQEGVDSKRLVVNSRGSVHELTADEFAAKVPLK